MFIGVSLCLQVCHCVYRYLTVLGVSLCLQVCHCVYRFVTVFTGVSLC